MEGQGQLGRYVEGQGQLNYDGRWRDSSTTTVGGGTGAARTVRGGAGRARTVRGGTGTGQLGR